MILHNLPYNDGSYQKALLEEFLAPRRCMRESIKEIFHVAELLDRAVDAHLRNDWKTASQLLREADMPEVRAWTESLWGGKQENPEQWRYHRWREIQGIGKPEPKVYDRMPTKKHQLEIIARDGYNCRFCGIPVIPFEIRKAITTAYPDAAYWRSQKNLDQHAALQCLWLQFDHILPHCWGGDSVPDNIVITCAPCNYGRGNWRLEEVGLIDPRERPVYRTSWDGLVRFLIE